MRAQQGLSTLELVLCLAGMALFAGLLLPRLDLVGREARRVQLRMAAENVQLNARLMALRCGAGFDLPCWERALATTRRAALAPGGLVARPEATRAAPATADAQGLLHALALAAGLGDADNRGPRWLMLPRSAVELEITLQGVNECRFVLRWQEAEPQVGVAQVEDRC